MNAMNVEDDESEKQTMAHTKFRNQIPAAILRSLFHPLMSGKTLLLDYTGRRNGRAYSTPVNYHQIDDIVLVATDSPWWKNFATPAPATVRIRGTDVPVRGQVITDIDEAVAALAAIIRAQPSYGRWAHVRLVKGEPNLDDVRAEVRRGRHVVRFHRQQGTSRDDLESKA
jgi:hypothetical protein